MFCNKNLQHGGLQVWPDFRIGRNVRTWMRWEYDVRLKRTAAGIVDQLGMSGIRLDRKPRKPGLADAYGSASALRVRTRSTARRRIMSHKEHKGHKRFVWSLRESCFTWRTRRALRAADPMRTGPPKAAFGRAERDPGGARVASPKARSGRPRDQPMLRSRRPRTIQGLFFI